MLETDPVLVRHKLDVDDFYRMAEAGIFAKNDRVELIEGDLIDMAPIGQDHEASVNVLARTLILAAGDDAIISVQNSLRLDRLSAPQPDFAVLRFRADWYRTGERPGPSDVLLLIEVSDTTVRFDHTVKLPLYARAGIPEVWIVDLQHRVLEAHRCPVDGAYAEATTHRAGDTVCLTMATDIVISLDRLFD